MILTTVVVRDLGTLFDRGPALKKESRSSTVFWWFTPAACASLLFLFAVRVETLTFPSSLVFRPFPLAKFSNSSIGEEEALTAQRIFILSNYDEIGHINIYKFREADAHLFALWPGFGIGGILKGGEEFDERSNFVPSELLNLLISSSGSEKASDELKDGTEVDSSSIKGSLAELKVDLVGREVDFWARLSGMLALCKQIKTECINFTSNHLNIIQMPE